MLQDTDALRWSSTFGLRGFLFSISTSESRRELILSSARSDDFFTPAECFFSGVFTSDYGLLGPFMVTFLPDPVAFSINSAKLFQCINLQGAFLAPIGALIVIPFRDPPPSTIHIYVWLFQSVQYGLGRSDQNENRRKWMNVGESGRKRMKLDECGW